MKKLFLFVLIANIGFSINGTITFYDGTTLDGELSSSDVRHVFITPEGLVMPEKIPVVDIDNFKLDNGIIMIKDGIAQQTYLDGKFSIIQRDDEKEEYSTSEFQEYADYDLGNLNYFSVSTFYGMPVYFRPSLLLEDDKNPSSLPNLGFDFSSPYLPIGPVNMSLGGRLITCGFDKEFGARPIKRAIQKYLEDPLAKKIVNSEVKKGDKIEISHKSNSEALDIKITSK